MNLILWEEIGVVCKGIFERIFLFLVQSELLISVDNTNDRKEVREGQWWEIVDIKSVKDVMI